MGFESECQRAKPRYYCNFEDSLMQSLIVDRGLKIDLGLVVA
ncbi:hypothetical protein FOQG_04746 [Fusarium oxysporum f. sp. raphani 54005]|uniref:Uncharacterized protein n=2 Tax=Fusarium oxysporum TaxID=5507 RepID=X0CRF5_FUSOX|nr:hypothetical protein FOQG_04746 [Fusarium oxysporum f. sp. raphani 54005]EXL72299.1 hypothetical protein FOPG_12143 [Fusarium oxysporum f. sp. conglutinans race 2 54008]KAI8419524.1 hypothetical protein FOFC_02113 [Fusarium oxysporum]